MKIHYKTCKTTPNQNSDLKTSKSLKQNTLPINQKSKKYSKKIMKKKRPSQTFSRICKSSKKKWLTLRKKMFHCLNCKASNKFWKTLIVQDVNTRMKFRAWTKIWRSWLKKTLRSSKSKFKCWLKSLLRRKIKRILKLNFKLWETSTQKSKNK